MIAEGDMISPNLNRSVAHHMMATSAIPVSLCSMFKLVQAVRNYYSSAAANSILQIDSHKSACPVAVAV